MKGKDSKKKNYTRYKIETKIKKNLHQVMIHLKRNTKRVKQEKNNQLRKLKNIKVITILVLKKNQVAQT